MLTCDKCVRSYHGHCLRPAIQYRKWFVPSAEQLSIVAADLDVVAVDRRNARLMCQSVMASSLVVENLLTCFVNDCNTSYHPTCLEPAVRMNVYEADDFFVPCKETVDAYTESLKASEKLSGNSTRKEAKRRRRRRKGRKRRRRIWIRNA